MAESSRLSGLPGYDTAPDVYEAGDDSSLTQHTSPRSAVETEPTSEEDEGEDDEQSFGLSRRRLRPSRARRTFEGTSRRVETKGTDLSDRIDEKRRGYRVRKRRSSVDDGTEAESLEARIARLRRELEECKAEVEEAKAEGGADGDDEGTGELMDDLSQLLAGISLPAKTPRRPLGAPIQDADELSEEQLLGRVSDFDTRLAALEQALGIAALDMTSDAVAAPVLPSLNMLDEQLTALTSATSLTSLEAASSRIQKLKIEAENLSHAGTESNGEQDEDSGLIAPEDIQNLQRLYTLLPNLQSLAPTVPAMLSRLRSLRTLHTGAANAASELEEVEKRQAEMDNELKAWREGLEKVERAVSQADLANGNNGRFVERWVKELEGRVRALDD